MAEPVVEVHIPLIPAEDGVEGGYPFPYLETVENLLFGLDGQGRGEMLDGGEEYQGEYLYFLANAPESALLELAAAIRDLPGVPSETYAVVSDTDAEEWGAGRRVELGG